MALPADFNKIYGSTATGGLTPISDVDYAKGWEFVGSNPPTKNDFSYLQNSSDLKAQWLYLNKLQRTDPFGDIKSDGTVSTALSNLGLGGAAKLNVGTTEGTVAAGNDARFGLMIGVGQSWVNVTSSRAAKTTYTNDTGKPIMVLVTANAVSVNGADFIVDGVVVSLIGGSDVTILRPLSVIVPAGSTYRISDDIRSNRVWSELR